MVGYTFYNAFFSFNTSLNTYLQRLQIQEKFIKIETNFANDMLTASKT